jgi:hypothetical protein
MSVGERPGLKNVAHRRPGGPTYHSPPFKRWGPKENPSPGRDGICDPNVPSAAVLILSPMAKPQSLP